MTSVAAFQEQNSVYELAILDIRLDGGTQMRAFVNSQVVYEYSRLLYDGVVFPPVRVWFDGDCYWLADGFHRIEAHKVVGRHRIDAEVKPGTLEDARWDSLKANSKHGLRRSRADLMLLATKALNYHQTAGISINKLADHLTIPEPTLRRWIKKLTSSNDEVTHRASSPGASRGDQDNRLPSLVRERHRIWGELELLKRTATRSEMLAVVNILEKWLIGAASTTRTCEAIERLFHAHGTPPSR